MNLTKVTLTVFALMLAFTSCNKTYTCNCEIKPGAMPKNNHAKTVDVKAKNNTEAAAECDEYDNEYIDCNL